MKNLKLHVEYECPSCKGSGTQINPEYDEHEQFLKPKYDPCGECSGLKVVRKFVPIEQFIHHIAEMELNLESEELSILGEDKDQKRSG